MTQARSNYTGRYFRFVFGKIRVCFIFSILFSAFCIPPFCLSHNEGSTAVNAIELTLALISTLGLLAVTFITPLIAMKHLYTKTMADNILSLPLTAAQRYFCELGAVLLCLAVPFAAISIPFSAAVVPQYLMIAIHGLLFMVMLCVFDVFLMTLCGRLTEAILYPIVLNILIPLVIWFGMHLGLMNIFGCGDYDFAMYSTYSTMRLYWTGVMILSLVSPFGNFITTLGLIGESLIAIVTALIFIAVMIPLGLFTYSKRHSEKIGQSFVYKPVYAVTSVMVAFFAVVCYFWAAETNLRNGEGGKGFFNLIPTAFPVLAGGLLFLMALMELVNYKKIKSLPRLLLRYAGVLAAGTLVSFVLYESDGFGESDYIPSADETVYVVASSSIWERIGDDYGNYQDSYLDVTAEGDGELAAYLRSIHRALKDNRENGNWYRYEDPKGSVIVLSYYLKNGSVIRREYFTDLPADHWKTIIGSEEYRYSDLLMTDQSVCYTYSWHETIYEESFTRLTEVEPVAVQLSNAAIRDSDRNKTAGVSVLIESIDYYELREALEKDLRADANFGRHNEIPIGNLQIGQMYDDEKSGERYFSSYFFGFSYTIYESYTNTIELLSRYAEIPTAEEVARRIFNHCEYFTLARVSKFSTEQGVAPKNRYYFFVHEENRDEALLTGEQFIEALSHMARYTYDDGERDYMYAIICGAPNAMSGEVKESMLHSWLLDPAVLISEEFYDTLDQWYEAGYIPSAPETEDTSVSVEYGCQAR